MTNTIQKYAAIALMLLSFTAQPSFAQKKKDVYTPNRFKTRNVIWFSPLDAREVNGLAVGLMSGAPFSDDKIKINGLNIDADPLSVFVLMNATPGLFKQLNPALLPDTLYSDASTNINGISISGGGLVSGGRLNGLFVNGFICEGDHVSGIFVTAGITTFQQVNGISISGFKNTAIKCNGLQIGLINVCKHLKGLQIGLWNVNSKRKLPFINWGT